MPRRALVPVLLAAALVAGCGSSRHATTSTVSTAATPTAQGTVWLCLPGRASDPCASSLATTVVRANGSTTVQRPKIASHPSIDCFYVYPTVSDEDRGNADLAIQLPEIIAAQAQAERFSQVCRVYAPMYRQITDRGLTTPSLHARPLEAYDSLLAAWRDYLAHDNHGRGVVLIGHSQGAYILKHLVATEIDRSAAERRLLVSAILLGGQVLAGNSPGERGDFAHIPPCASANQIALRDRLLELRNDTPGQRALRARPERDDPRALCQPGEPRVERDARLSRRSSHPSSSPCSAAVRRAQRVAPRPPGSPTPASIRPAASAPEPQAGSRSRGRTCPATRGPSFGRPSVRAGAFTSRT